MKPIACASICLFMATQTEAMIEVNFRDGNPWDVFTITNAGCAIIQADLTIDLSTSVAGVLIDTEYGGPGTQDPMPAELSEGHAVLAPVTDGDQRLVVTIGKLDTENLIQLRLDVDDTQGSRYAPKIEVYGDEITGATVTLRYAGDQTFGTFDAEGNARIPLPKDAPDCLLLS